MTLINLSSNIVNAQVRLYNEFGSDMVLPLTFPQSAVSTTSSTFNVTLRPGETIVAETEAPSTGVNVGWADVQASGPLAGYAVFRLRGPGGPDSEGTVPLDNRPSTSIAFPYDETSGFRTGIALTNLSASRQTVTATLLDDNGSQLGTAQITLQPLGHSAFYVDERFPPAFRHLGIVQFQSGSGLTGIGLRFNPTGSFTSIPFFAN